MDGKLKQRIKDWVSENFCDGVDQSKDEREIYDVTAQSLFKGMSDLIEHLSELDEDLKKKADGVKQMGSGIDLYDFFEEFIEELVLADDEMS